MAAWMVHKWSPPGAPMSLQEFLEDPLVTDHLTAADVARVRMRTRLWAFDVTAHDAHRWEALGMRQRAMKRSLGWVRHPVVQR